MSQQWLAHTKFLPPVQPEGLLARETLRAALAAAAGKYRLVLLSAAAGYGKTTLLSSLNDASTGMQVAWFSLDAEDNDPVRFLVGALTAIGRVHSTFGGQTQQLLTTMAAMGPGSVSHDDVIQAASAFINDASEDLDAPLLLVLDDLHFISEPLIVEALDYVLEHMPERLHIAAASRYDPAIALSRLRGKRQVFELRLDDLRFSLDEAGAFLNHALYLNLSDEEIALIHTRTEGWAAGLVLLTGAISGSERGDRSHLLGRIDGQERLTFDFLAEEVLNRQPADLREFLLETAILDELTPALCDAVTGKTNARIVLESLFRRNLFISLIGPADPPTYQYHALFSEFLRQQLEKESPDRLAELHRRAGQGETLAGRKIHHFVAAGSWDEAAAIIEQNGEQIAFQGMLATLTDWLAAIPESIDDKHPRLRYLRGISALARGDSAGVDAILDHSLRAYESLDDQENVTASLCALASLAFTQARFDDCQRFLDQALALPARIDTRVTLLMIEASLALFVRSQWEIAGRDLREAIRLVRDNHSDEALLMLSMYLGQEFTVLPGMMDLLETFCSELVGSGQEWTSPVQLGAADVLTFIHLRRGRIEAALETGDRAIAFKAAHSGFPFLGLNAALTCSMAAVAKQDYPRSEKYLDLAQRQLDQLPLNRVLVNHAYFYRARLGWLDGQPDKVKQISGRMAAETFTLPYAPALRHLLDGIISMSAKNFDEATRQMQEAVNTADRELLATVQATPRVWLAYLYDQWKRPDDALGTFERVLDDCLLADTPGCILQEGSIALPLLRMAALKGDHTEYARHLLDLLGEPLAARTGKTVAGLTEREVEVVRLIAEGASNKTIAEALYISETTVKSHVAHIMNKLAASSRTEVVAQAHKLGLIW